MKIEDFNKEILARENMLNKTIAILHQLEGQLALLRELRERETKNKSNE